MEYLDVYLSFEHFYKDCQHILQIIRKLCKPFYFNDKHEIVMECANININKLFQSIILMHQTFHPNTPNKISYLEYAEN